MRAAASALAVIGLAAMASPASSSDERQAWFERAIQADLGGGESAVRAAYALFRRAAEAGLPEAEFNVAVLLDSGRGVQQDVGAAATWYARAAAHGNQRAAYNLGQLYEAGQGVPRNADLARAWFAASGLAAAHDHLTRGGPEPRHGGALASPVPVAPAAGEQVTSVDGRIEVVWLAAAEQEPVSFSVEVRQLDSTRSEEIFSGQSATSSLLASLPDKPGTYAWRVLAVANKAGRYAPSAWVIFHLGSSTTTSEAVDPSVRPDARREPGSPRASIP